MKKVNSSNVIKKKNKKRVWSLVAIISAIVLVVAGMVTGLVFLLRTPDDPRGSILTPELEDFVEDLNNGNKNDYDITEEIINLPATVMPEKVIYVDNKYIVAKNSAGADEIYKRAVNGATLIESFDNNGSPKIYNEYVEISGDYAYIKNGTLAESYIVNLKEEKVVEIIVPEVTDVTFKNGFVFLEFYTHNVQDDEDYLSLKCIHLDSSAICLSVNAEDKAKSLVMGKSIITLVYEVMNVYYNYEVEMNSLVKVYELKTVDYSIVDDGYVPNDNEFVVENDGTSYKFNGMNDEVLSNEKFVLFKNYVLVKNPTLANYRMTKSDGSYLYFVVSYTKLDKATGEVSNFEYLKNLVNTGDDVIIDGYYGLTTKPFDTYDADGNILNLSSKSMLAIFDGDLNFVFEYNEDQYGSIVFYDGEYLITSGAKSCFLNIDGTKANVIDSDKFYISTQNVWNNMFVVKGVMGYGISDNKGNVIASPSFEMLSAIIDGHTIGYYDGHYYRIDLINKVAILISNYEVQGDILRALGTGMYVTNIDSKIDVCDFTGKVLYEDIKDLHLIGFENDYSVIKLLVETEEEVVVLKSSVINRALAKSFENGEYNGTAIDDSIEAEERIENLNITNLSKYSKIEVVEEDNSESEGEENEPNSMIAENADYSSAIINYEDAYPESAENALSSSSLNLSLKLPNFVSINSSTGNPAPKSNTISFKQIVDEISNYEETGEPLFGLFADVESMKAMLPDMIYPTGTSITDQAFGGVIFKDSLGYYYHDNNIRFTCVKFYKLADSGIIAISLVQGVESDDDEKFVGFGFYVSVVFKTGVMCNSLNIKRFGSNKSLKQVVNICRDAGSGFDTSIDMEQNMFYSDIDGIVVNGANSGFANTLLSSSFNDNKTPTKGNLEIRLADGSSMYGFGTSLTNINILTSQYWDNISMPRIYTSYNSVSSMCDWYWAKKNGDKYSIEYLQYYKDSGDDDPVVLTLDLSYCLTQSSIDFVMFDNDSYPYDDERTFNSQFFKVVITKDGDRDYTLDIIPAVGYKVTYWKIKFKNTKYLSGWNPITWIGPNTATNGTSKYWDNINKVDTSGESFKDDGSVHYVMTSIGNSDTDYSEYYYLSVTVEPIVHTLKFYDLDDKAVSGESSADTFIDYSNPVKIYYAAPALGIYKDSTNNSITNAMLGTGISGENILPEINSSYPNYYPNSIMFGIGSYGMLSAKHFYNTVFGNRDGYNLTGGLYGIGESYGVITSNYIYKNSDDKPVYYCVIDADSGQPKDLSPYTSVGLIYDGMIDSAYGTTYFDELFKETSSKIKSLYVHYTPQKYNLSFYLGDLSDVDNKVKIKTTNITYDFDLSLGLGGLLNPTKITTNYCDDISYDYNSALTLEENNLNNILKLYQTSTPNSIQYNSPNTIVGSYVTGGSGVVLPTSPTPETKAPESEDLNDNGYELKLEFTGYYGETLLGAINNYFKKLYNKDIALGSDRNNDFYYHMSIANYLPTFITPVSMASKPYYDNQTADYEIEGSMSISYRTLMIQSNFFEWGIELNKNVSDNNRTVFNTPTKDNAKLSGSSVSSSDAGLALTVYTNQNLVRKHGNEIAPKNIFVTQLDAFNYLEYIYKCVGWNVLDSDGIAIATMSGTTNFTYSNMKDLFTYMFDGIGAGTNLDTYFNIVFYAQYDEHTPFDYEFKINGESYEFVEENADDENAEDSESSEQEEIISNFKYAVADYENMSALTESQYNPYIEQGVMSIEQGKGIIIKFDLNPDYYLGGVEFEKIFGSSRYNYDETAFSKQIVNYVSSWSIFDDDPELKFKNGMNYRRQTDKDHPHEELTEEPTDQPYVVTCEETYDSEKGVTIRSYTVIIKNIGMGSLTTSGAVGGRISLSIYPREFETDTDNSQGGVQSFTTNNCDHYALNEENVCIVASNDYIDNKRNIMLNNLIVDKYNFKPFNKYKISFDN